MWTQARFAAYLTGAIGGLAAVLHVLGVVDYNAATGMVDPRPFNLWVAGGFVIPPLAAGLASVMVWVQGRRK